MRISLIFKSIALGLIAWTVALMNPDMPIWGDSGYVDYHGGTIWVEPKYLSDLINAKQFSDPLVVTSLYALLFLYITTLLIFASFVISLVLLIRKKKMPVLVEVPFLLLIIASSVLASAFFFQALDHNNPACMRHSIYPVVSAILCVVPSVVYLTTKIIVRRKQV